jgi:hypothetical protein
MAHQDAFTLKNSPVNPFLFAEVGIELNGSSLTVLSVLARLGEDPWSMAQSWSKLPRPAVIERLAERIRQMPLCQQALLDARVTASRLSLLLLPAQEAPAVAGRQAAGGVGMPKWAPMVMLCGALAFGAVVNMIAFAEHPAPLAAPTEQVHVPQ